MKQYFKLLNFIQKGLSYLEQVQDVHNANFRTRVIEISVESRGEFIIANVWTQKGQINFLTFKKKVVRFSLF